MSDQQRLDAAVTLALDDAAEEWWHVEGETGWTMGLESIVDPRHADLVQGTPDGPQAVYVRFFKPYDTPDAIDALAHARQVLSQEPTSATDWVEQAEALSTRLYLQLHASE